MNLNQFIKPSFYPQTTMKVLIKNNLNLNKYFFILIAVILFNVRSFGQSNLKEVAVADTRIVDKNQDVYNSYIDFVNESIHGMFLVNRLLVEYNLDINKYVDLETEKINNYSNKDLPKDIFEDKEHWFYEVSPYELYAQLNGFSKKLPASEATVLNALAAKFLNTIKQANQLRLDMDLVSQGVDLKVKSNLDKVYVKLEEGVKLFENFFVYHQEFEKFLDSRRIKFIPDAEPMKSNYKNIAEIIGNEKAILLQIRNKKTEYIDQIISQNLSAASKFKKSNFDNIVSSAATQNKIKLSFANASKSADDFTRMAQSFAKNENIPSKYQYYGRYYFYYNVDMISKFNKYGSGLVFESNQILNFAKSPSMKFVELPHLFQIIYPKKVVKELALKSSDEVVEALPVTVKDRKVNGGRQMKVESNVVELELYDHLIADGDVVSINFNGDWILEKETLERGSKKMKLQLNPVGRNYLLLHADNVGKRPPNTMALSYIFRGDKKEIVLKSDNDFSELIEIVIVK
jgi:hypothetical protein